MSVLDLQALLEQRLRGAFSALLSDMTGSLVLTDGRRAAWSVEIDHGRLSARPGAADAATTTVTATPDVLAAVVDGERSGIDAFLDGELTVRGSLALALQMDGLFVPDESVARTRARRVTVGGVDTFYLEAGPLDAPPVVLVHGLGATNASMLPLVQALAPDFHVLAPDLPGHGGTMPVRESYAATFLGTWLLAFLRQVLDSPAVLVGNSLGGRTALEAALIDPAAARGLVLLCPAVAFRRLRQFVPVVRLVRPELSALPLRVPRRVTALGLRRLFADPARLPAAWYDAALDEFVRMMHRPAGRIAFFAALRHLYLDRAYGEDGFWDRLSRLVPPALFVWGDKDVLVPSGYARHVSDALPSARSVVFGNCGHVPQFEHPERTSELVVDFVREVSPITY